MRARLSDSGLGLKPSASMADSGLWGAAWDVPLAHASRTAWPPGACGCLQLWRLPAVCSAIGIFLPLAGLLRLDMVSVA